MRIAFVDYVCDPARPATTGLSDVVWDMAGRLARLGEEVHVIAPYTTDGVPERAVHVHRFPIPPVGYRNILGHLLIVAVACRRLRSVGPVDVVHVPEYLSAAVLSSVLRHTPVVLTEPGNIYQRVAHGNPYDPVTTIVFKLAARRAAARCARLVATSADLERWWRLTGFSPERVCRVPLGIDTRVFRRVSRARQSLGLRSDARVVLFAARLSRDNGADVALRAIARLRQRIAGLAFHVLGDGPERQSLALLARSLSVDDLTTWHGWVEFSRLPQFYSAADAFVFSGFSGGTPRVLLQAMGCGAPVVASSIGGIVDHVQHGRNGFLFPAGSHNDLADALEVLLSRPETSRRLGRAAVRYARASLDWDVLVERLRAEVYRPAILDRQIRVQERS